MGRKREQRDSTPLVLEGKSRARLYVLAAILLIGALLRIVGLTSVPPGLNQDEAANAWNAWCLLHHGTDEYGTPWPIFYMRCFGEFRSPLFIYLLIPFQAIGGLNVWTTRLPCAAGGVATVALLYCLGSRWFGRGTGLIAAALMAVNPWHVQQSRWGHEGGLTAFLVIAPIAAWVWAGLPLGVSDRRVPSVWKCALAGLVTGVCCYGYPAVRIFLPLFFAAAILTSLPAFWGLIRTRRGVAAMTALAAGVAATFGPLAWRHWTDEKIGKRGRMGWIWAPEDSTGTKIGKALKRYPPHFGPKFLFTTGDEFIVQTPLGMGMFPWYALPLMAAGAGFAAKRWRSTSSRVLLAWLVLYPIGDCLNEHLSPHAMRSLPGLGALILLAAVGAEGVYAWVSARRREAAVVGAIVTGLIAAAVDGRYFARYFAEFNQGRIMQVAFHAPLVEAVDYFRSQWNQIDALICTTEMVNEPYAVIAVTLPYDVNEWFTGRREVIETPMWSGCGQMGKIHVAYDPRRLKAEVERLRNNGREDRVLFFLQWGSGKELGRAVKVFRFEDGGEAFWLCETKM